MNHSADFEHGAVLLNMNWPNSSNEIMIKWQTKIELAYSSVQAWRLNHSRLLTSFISDYFNKICMSQLKIFVSSFLVIDSKIGERKNCLNFLCTVLRFALPLDQRYKVLKHPQLKRVISTTLLEVGIVLSLESSKALSQ